MGKLLRFGFKWVLNCRSAPTGLAMPATTVKSGWQSTRQKYCNTGQQPGTRVSKSLNH